MHDMPSKHYNDEQGRRNEIYYGKEERTKIMEMDMLIEHSSQNQN